MAEIYRHMVATNAVVVINDRAVEKASLEVRGQLFFLTAFTDGSYNS